MTVRVESSIMTLASRHQEKGAPTSTKIVFDTVHPRQYQTLSNNPMPRQHFTSAGRGNAFVRQSAQLSDVGT